jgi:hypothetical protein
MQSPQKITVQILESLKKVVISAKAVCALNSSTFFFAPRAFYTYISAPKNSYSTKYIKIDL